MSSKAVLAPWTKTPHGKFQVNQTLGGVLIAIFILFSHVIAPLIIDNENLAAVVWLRSGQKPRTSLQK